MVYEPPDRGFLLAAMICLFGSGPAINMLDQITVVKKWALGPLFVSGFGMIRQAHAHLRQLLEPVISVLGYELVGIEYLGQGRNNTLRIYIDKTEGVTLDDCEKVSRQVSGLLDVEDPIQERYTLEVSSPGADRPLFTREHFDSNKGRWVRLRLDKPLDGRRNFKGIIQGMNDEEVLLDVDGTRFSLPLKTIEKARLIPDI